MKLNKDFVLRQVADTWIVLPVGTATVSFNGMLTLNASGAILWKALEQGADCDALVDSLMNEYIVDRAQALADVQAFLEKMKKAGCLLD